METNSKSLNGSDVERLVLAIPGLVVLLRADDNFTVAGASSDYMRATHMDASALGQALFKVLVDDPGQPEIDGVRELRASLQRVRATGRQDATAAQRYHVRLPPSAGGGSEAHYWTAVNSPVPGRDGAVEYIVHRVEEATAKGNPDALRILESITEGFFTLDHQWRFDYVNPEAHRILSRELGDLSGKVLWTVYPGLEGTDFERNYHRTMYERQKSSFTAFYPNLNRWYEVTTFPAPEGVSVYFRDVTQQKIMQAERDALVADSEKQRRIFETSLNSTPDFFYVLDTQHRVLYANDSLLATWGVDNVLGKRWTDLGYEKWHADLHDLEIDEVVRTRAPIRGEMPFTGTGGTRIYDYIFSPVLGAGGDVVAIAGITRDITERQIAEQESRHQADRLAQVDQAKDEFLATLSHELRNPLAPLRHAIQLLRTPGRTDRPDAIYEMMDRQITHLVRLVDDLLEMSRISRGALSLRAERVELAAVVRNALETSDPLIKTAGHALDVQLPGEPLWVQGDPVRLAQIISNLLNNAAKYTEHAGHIALRVRREFGDALISVADDGIGISPRLLPRLFEMFSRGDSDIANHQSGLGIGLALSRRLAQMHDGTLTVRSDGPGKGSEFTLRLPLAEAGPEEAATKAEEDSSLSHLHVLVIDDNSDAANSLGMVLEMFGAQVQIANGGVQGLEAFAARQPSVVLLDIGMPGMNGYEVARAIRQRFPDTGVTLIALTGWGQEGDRRRATEAGFDHHIVKPADLHVLKALLSSLDIGKGDGKRDAAGELHTPVV